MPIQPLAAIHNKPHYYYYIQYAGRGEGRGLAAIGDWRDVGGSAADGWPEPAALELDAL